MLLLLFLHRLGHRFGAAYQDGILSAASRAEMANVEEMKKIVPLITCGVPFGQHVCELVFGVNVTDLNFEVQINPVKTNPKQLCGFLTHVSLWDFGLYHHFNYGFSVLKDIQYSTGTRMCSA